MKKIFGKHIIKRVYVKRLGSPAQPRCDYFWGGVKLPHKLGERLWQRSGGPLWRKIG